MQASFIIFFLMFVPYLTANRESESIEDREKHLHALFLRKLGKLEEACDYFKQMKSSPLIDFDHALTHFEMGHYKEAKVLLEACREPLLKNHAKLWLSKINIEEGHFEEARKCLSDLGLCPLDETLYYETLFAMGDLEFRQKRFSESMTWLEKTLPKRNAELASWTAKTLKLMGKVYIQWAETPSLNLHEKKRLLQKAEIAYLRLAAEYPDDDFPTEMVHFYCLKSRLTQEPEALKACQAILEKENFFLDPVKKSDSYHLLGDRAYLDGLQSHKFDFFLEAVQCFEMALRLDTSPREPLRIKQIQCLNQEGSPSSLEKSARFIQELENSPIEHPLLPLLKAEWNLKTNQDASLKETLQITAKKLLSSPYRETGLYLLGTLAWQMGDYAESFSQLSILIELYPESPYLAEALYWAGRSLAELSSSSEKSRPYYQALYEKFPNSPHAAEAYFSMYHEEDYLLGNKGSLKHLQGFKERFQNSPLLLIALYLEALDFLRDRKSPEGKTLSRKNFTSAISAFHQVETAFDTLYEQGALFEHLSQWIFLKYRAALERAKANYAIAIESRGAKRQIYLQYALEVLTALKRETSQAACHLSLEEEASYYLALTQIEQEDLHQANLTLHEMLRHYSSLDLHKGYYLVKTYYLLGQVALKEKKEREALFFYDQALSLADPSTLTTDEKLEILIEKGQAFQGLGNLDEAMKQLSEVVNYQAVSSLRLKAMYLRAEIYALQGRRMLARKQLLSLSLKAGEWAKKAKETLDKEFGYE